MSKVGTGLQPSVTGMSLNNRDVNRKRWFEEQIVKMKVPSGEDVKIIFGKTPDNITLEVNVCCLGLSALVDLYKNTKNIPIKMEKQGNLVYIS